MKENIHNQEGAIIRTLHSSNVAYARIYSEEQRMRIKQLIQHNFLPHHTSVGSVNPQESIGIWRSTKANMEWGLR